MTCTRGLASIHLGEEPLGSLAGDDAGAVPGTLEEQEQRLLVRAHERKRDPVAEGRDDYQEEEPETVRTGYGRARRSGFTALGAHGHPVRGYRATVVGAATVFEIVCQCPEVDWENLQPAFARVIESLSVGTAEP